MFTPIKVGPDSKARGWKPIKGWYLWNTTTHEIDFHQTAKVQGSYDKPFTTKRECQKACDQLNKGE